MVGEKKRDGAVAPDDVGKKKKKKSLLINSFHAADADASATINATFASWSFCTNIVHDVLPFVP
jgi:hypothetical protein